MTNGDWFEVTLSTAPNVDAATAAVTNLNFFNGFVTNNSLSVTTAAWIAFDRMGFNDDGTTNTYKETAYVTKLLRLPYPLFFTNDVLAQNVTNVVVRLALSKPISSRDSNLTFTARAGYIASTNLSAFTNAAAVSSAAVTNESTLPYAPVHAQWASVPFQAVGDSYDVYVVAFHHSAQGAPQRGRPVRFVRIRSGYTGTFVTNYAYHPVLIRGSRVGMAMCLYKVTVSTASFSQGKSITNHFDVFPWGGDTNETTEAVRPFPFPQPYVVYCDKDTTYRSNFIAIVDSTNPGASPRVTNTTPANVNSAQYFGSISAALNGIAASNNAFCGHNDIGGGRVYVKSGTNTWLGTSTSYGASNALAWCWITNYPGQNLGDAIIATVGGDKTARSGGLLAVGGMMWTNNPGTGVVFDEGALWVDNCIVNANGTAVFQQATNAYFTSSIVTNLGQGIKPVSSGYLCPWLIMDCDFTGLTTSIQGHCIIGNYKGGNTTPVGTLINMSTPNSPVCTNAIIAFNWFGGFKASAAMITFPSVTNFSKLAVVQNVFEITTQSTSQELASWGGGADSECNNWLFWNNDLLGERTFDGYMNVNANTFRRDNWSRLGDVVTQMNTKHDNHNGTGGPNGARLGGWPVNYGVGWEGVASLQSTNFSAAGSFQHEFIGMNSYQPRTSTYDSLGEPNGIPNPTNFARWTLDGSDYGSVITGSGNGNYRLLSESPLFMISTPWVLPFDLEGKSRSAVDPPGAYSAGNLRQAPLGF